MGKITKVLKSRNEYTCGRCLQKIEKGSPYLRGDLNFSRPVIRCCKCGLQPWEVTTSDYQLSVGEIVYHWQDNYDVSEEGRDEIISELESIKDDLEGRLENMPEGLQEGDAGQLLQERIDCLESAISDLESIDFELDDDEEMDEDKEIEYRVQIESALENIEV